MKTTVAQIALAATLIASSAYVSTAHAQIMLQCKVVKTGQIITVTGSCPQGTYQIGAINVPGR